MRLWEHFTCKIKYFSIASNVVLLRCEVIFFQFLFSDNKAASSAVIELLFAETEIGTSKLLSIEYKLLDVKYKILKF